MNRPGAAGALCLLALFGTAPLRAAEAGRLDQEVRPTFQEVRLDLDADRTTYSGSVRVALEIRAASERLRFHAEGIELKRVELAGPSGTIAVRHETEDGGLVALLPGRALAPGGYFLSIDFENTFGTRAVGLYRTEQAGQGYLFTQFEAIDARKAFPCWDEPGFKFPWQLTITVPEAHTAVTNTPVESESVAAGRRTLRFAKTKPLPSYLLAIAAGPLESVPIPGLSIPGRIITTQGGGRLAGMAASITPPLLAALEKYFGSPYPYEKLDLIAIPDYWPGAMENPGAITFAEPILLLDPALASPAQRRGLASITAHELAHMWFGDLVTMRWWDDLWLNEAFADWMGDKIAAQVHPDLHVELSEMASIRGVMSGDARPSSQAIRRPISAQANVLENLGTTYNKGKAVLSMFEAWMGPEKFRAGVNAYLKEHAWGNAEAADLWKALSAASGNDVSAALATFIDQPGLPLVSVERGTGSTIRLTQSRFLNFGASAPALRWRIPVTLRYESAGGSRTHSVLLTEPSQEVVLPGTGAPGWIHPSANASGYYQWSLPAEDLRRLVEKAPDALNARERIDLIGNLSALLAAGRLHADAWMSAVGSFGDDPSAHVVSAASGALAGARMPLMEGEARPAWAAFLRAAFSPALRRWGMSPKAGEEEAIALARPGLLEMLGDDGEDDSVLAFASERAAAYLKDPASVDPSISAVCLRLAAIRGDRALFDAYRSRFEKATMQADRARFLSAMGRFRDPALVDEALAYVLTGPLRARELFEIPAGMGRTAAGREQIYRYTVKNYDALAGRLPEMFQAGMPMVAAGCEPERVEAARSFFLGTPHEKPGMQATLARVGDQVADCVSLRQREGAAALAWLRARGKAGEPAQAGVVSSPGARP